MRIKLFILLFVCVTISIKSVQANRFSKSSLALDSLYEVDSVGIMIKNGIDDILGHKQYEFVNLRIIEGEQITISENLDWLEFNFDRKLRISNLKVKNYLETISPTNVTLYEFKIFEKQYYLVKAWISGATKYFMYYNMYLLYDSKNNLTYTFTSLGSPQLSFFLENKDKNLAVFEFHYSKSLFKKEIFALDAYVSRIKKKNFKKYKIIHSKKLGNDVLK